MLRSPNLLRRSGRDRRSSPSSKHERVDWRQPSRLSTRSASKSPSNRRAAWNLVIDVRPLSSCSTERRQARAAPTAPSESPRARCSSGRQLRAQLRGSLLGGVEQAAASGHAVPDDRRPLRAQLRSTARRRSGRARPIRRAQEALELLVVAARPATGGASMADSSSFPKSSDTGAVAVAHQTRALLVVAAQRDDEQARALGAATAALDPEADALSPVAAARARAAAVPAVARRRHPSARRREESSSGSCAGARQSDEHRRARGDASSAALAPPRAPRRRAARRR